MKATTRTKKDKEVLLMTAVWTGDLGIFDSRDRLFIAEGKTMILGPAGEISP